MSLDFFTSDGNVVLRAGQGSHLVHDFRIHKFILSLASPVFKDMFAFPQPPDHNEQPNTPIVDISEPPFVLDMILRLVYPGVELPNIPDVSTLNNFVLHSGQIQHHVDIPGFEAILEDLFASRPLQSLHHSVSVWVFEGGEAGTQGVNSG